MSIRKEMLERELRKLGFRKAEGSASTHASSAQQQQQPQGGSNHPQADGQASGGHSG